MITVAMPVGSSHGWGICGKYIAREMAALTPMRLWSEPFTAETVGDELEYQALAALRFGPADGAGAPVLNGVTHLPHALLTAVTDKRMGPWMPSVRGKRTVGYTFFEENILEPAWIDLARRCYDAVATGSSWNTQVLKGHGLANVETVIQGVDGRVFFPWPEGGLGGAPGGREFLRDRFVIFSGGKFELRKGQDIVIRAAAVMQQRHADVVLVNAWFNPWQQSVETMRSSPYLRWPPLTGTYIEVMNRLLAENGLDVARIVTLGPRANALMARVYRNTDVGLFPNRCEGGTNLVLMEYMACGKPVIAVDSTGHRDVVREDHALVIKIRGENTIAGPGGAVARWPEPDLEDAVEKLEWAYQHRGEMAALGARAGAAMARCTWTETARAFLKLLGPEQ
jgi:glycosyltransferase involved in cell wall biosynthesis